jgi:hypothetical protein
MSATPVFKGAAVPELNFEQFGIGAGDLNKPLDASAFGLCDVQVAKPEDPVSKAFANWQKLKGCVVGLPSVVMRRDEQKGTQVMDALEYMRRGSPVAKYKTSNTWKSGKVWPLDCRMFELSHCGKFIQFYSKKEVLQTITIAKIADIVPGQKSAEFTKRPWPEMNGLSFSICYMDDEAKPQVFDAVCVTQKDYDVWLHTLKQLKGKTGPLPFVELTTPIYENLKFRATLTNEERWFGGKKSDPEARRAKAENLVAQCEKLHASKHLAGHAYKAVASHKMEEIKKQIVLCEQNLGWEKLAIASELSVQATAQSQALELKLRCLRKEIRNAPASAATDCF